MAGSTPDSLSYGQRRRKPMVGSQFSRSERVDIVFATARTDRHIDMGLPLHIPKYCGLSDRSGVKPLSNMKILVLDALLDDVPAVSWCWPRHRCCRFPRVARPPVPQLPCGTLPLLVRQCKISGRPTALLEE